MADEHRHEHEHPKVGIVEEIVTLELRPTRDGPILVVEEIILVDLEDLEEHGKRGTKPKKAKSYRIVVDRQPLTVHQHEMTGREILKLVNKLPGEWSLTQKLHGVKREKIEPDEIVDFSARGIERFETAPMKVTNGDIGLRIPLTADDVEYLNATGLTWKSVPDSGGYALVLHGYGLPRAFTPSVVDLMIRVPARYPAALLDMFNFYPPVRRVDGRPLPCLTLFQFGAQTWQQWSRHRASWNPATDSVATHMALVENALRADAA